MDLTAIKNALKKPLKPLWIHPCSRMFLDVEEGLPFWNQKDIEYLDYYPVICVSASMSFSVALNGEQPIFPPLSKSQYIQGAADDCETWAPKLKPHHFWKLFALIDSSKSNEFFEREIAAIIDFIPAARNSDSLGYSWIGDSGIAIGDRKTGQPPHCWELFDIIINCGTMEYHYENEKCYLYLEIAEGKKGQYELLNSFPVVFEYLQKLLTSNKKVLVHCMQGLDRSVGIAIALLLRFGDSTRKLCANSPLRTDFSKQDVMNTLLYIKKYRPIAAPTRATMKRLNAYFVRT